MLLGYWGLNQLEVPGSLHLPGVTIANDRHVLEVENPCHILLDHFTLAIVDIHLHASGTWKHHCPNCIWHISSFHTGASLFSEWEREGSNTHRWTHSLVSKTAFYQLHFRDEETGCRKAKLSNSLKVTVLVNVEVRVVSWNYFLPLL